jgi:hypothetical protein
VRKALVVQAGYPQSELALPGTFNSAYQLWLLLLQLGYRPWDILVLRDQTAVDGLLVNDVNRSSLGNILSAMAWLVEGLQPSGQPGYNKLFFYFTGE